MKTGKESRKQGGFQYTPTQMLNTVLLLDEIKDLGHIRAVVTQSGTYVCPLRQLCTVTDFFLTLLQWSFPRPFPCGELGMGGPLEIGLITTIRQGLLRNGGRPCTHEGSVGMALSIQNRPKAPHLILLAVQS